MSRDNEIEIPEAWMCMIKQHNSLMISTTVSCYNNADRNPPITKGKSKDWNAPITTMLQTSSKQSKRRNPHPSDYMAYNQGSLLQTTMNFHIFHNM